MTRSLLNRAAAGLVALSQTAFVFSAHGDSGVHASSGHAASHAVSSSHSAVSHATNHSAPSHHSSPSAAMGSNHHPGGHGPVVHTPSTSHTIPSSSIHTVSHTNSANHVVHHPGTGRTYPASTHLASHTSSSHWNSSQHRPIRYVPPVGGYHGPRWSSNVYTHFGWKSNPTGWYGRFGRDAWCIGNGYSNWSYQYWSARYSRPLYYDRTTTAWYFYQPTFSCYVPYRYITYYTQPVLTGEGGSVQVVSNTVASDEYPTSNGCSACGVYTAAASPVGIIAAQPLPTPSPTAPDEPAPPSDPVAGNLTPVSDNNPPPAPDADSDAPGFASMTPR